MNHELVVLRGVLRMKKSAEDLHKTVQKLALKSFSTVNCRDGTMGQVEQICAYTEKRDKLMSFYNGAMQALKNTPKGFRALICEVYLYNTDKATICQRYNVSLSTLYRYLSKARKTFKEQLEFLGMSESWLWQNYGDVSWVASMLQKDCKGRPCY